MVNSIRADLVKGDRDSAYKSAKKYVKHFPDEPAGYFYRAIVFDLSGYEDAALEEWALLSEVLFPYWADGEYHEPLDESEVGRFGEEERMKYFIGWALRGLGDIEESRSIFKGLADQLESTMDGVHAVIARPELHYYLACYRSMSGELDIAIEHWERSNELGFNTGSGWWRVDPDLRDLHENPRFWESGEKSGESERETDSIAP